jgi:hypothetical protein
MASPDLSVESFLPADLECFSVPFRVLLGPHGGEGEESFDFSICSPAWIENRCRKDGFVIGRHLIVVPSYEVTKIVEVIEKIVRSISGESWEEVGLKFSRYAYWEFEDYRD